ncbi:MAG: AAA family ATPase [Roseburia inulinivorans]
MIKMISVKEAARQWNITERRVAELCRSGRIEGTVRQGRSWQIPADASKPADKRIRSGSYRKNQRSSCLPLPIGVSDFRLAQAEYYYVDKTMLIKDFIDERPMVTLFTRPRRFGKTLNMDMLRTFFEKTEQDTSVYFQDKKIWACGQKYRSYQGKYPVIFLTFKDVKFNTWEETFSAVRDIFAKETQRHEELRTSDRCDEYDERKYARLAEGNVTEVELSSALADLSAMLHKHHGTAPVIIIDEYDTPIQQGYMKGYYEEITLFMRNLFSGGFKDNKHLAFGFLTGILRVAKESIFSGMNNLSINSVLDHKYSAYFGFTPDEVREMAAYYGASDKYDEICEWYDGYRFGKTEIFNPWSVVNYFSNECEPRAFWVSTGSNDVIGEVLAEADEEIYHRLASLVNGETITTYIDTGVIYPQIKKNPSTIYSFLLVTGYLKALKTTLSFNWDFMCEISLPNREIALVYHKEILQKFEAMIPQSTAIAVQEAIFSGDNRKLKTQIQTLLMESVSSFDTAGENFYHGFMLGLCALLGGFFVTSNRESGEGRYDIQLKPVKKGLPGIIIELKAEKNGTEESLKQLSETALKQIQEKQYDTELRAAGVEVIYKYGVAFCGKRVEIAVG